MNETFFSTKEASRLTGCTLRQLQYWREKEIIVPTISATGTGRSIYYSRSQLLELAVMEYLLSVGLTFEAASRILKQLKEQESEFLQPQQKRWMLCWEGEKQLSLQVFDLEEAIAFFKEGKPVIPVWLDAIAEKLEKVVL